MKKIKNITHLRRCRRCKSLFRTSAKFGRICTNCHRGPWVKQDSEKK